MTIETHLLVRETGAGIYRKVIEHQEGREVSKLRGANGSAHPCASTLGLLGGKENLPDRTRNRHIIHWKCAVRVYFILEDRKWFVRGVVVSSKLSCGGGVFEESAEWWGRQN